MTARFLIFFSVLVLFFSCSSEDDTEGNISRTEGENTIVDTDSPLITTNELSPTIEEKVILDISVEDESSVETKIFINGNEQYSSSLKEFQYEINPYSIPVGVTELKVEATDSENNTSEKEFSFDTRHFLMDFNLNESERIQFKSLWVFFNDLEGNILAALQPELGSNKIYTEEIVAGEEMYYTISKLTEQGSGQSKRLRVTTYRVKLGERREELQFGQAFSNDNYVEVDINRVEEDSGYSKFVAKGSEYGTVLFGGGGFLTRIGVDYGKPNLMFIRTDVVNGLPTLFDGQRENYKYFSFQPKPSEPMITIDETDFIGLTEYFPLLIPEHSPGSFDINRYGFENQDMLESNINHHIYEVNEPNDQYRNEIDLPVLDGLEYYNNVVVYSNGGKNYFGNLFGNDIDISMPDWNLNFGILGNEIFLEGNNVLDYYAVRFFKSDNSGSNNQKSMIWDYRTMGSETEKRSIILDLPPMLENDLNDSFFSTNDFAITSVSALDFEEFSSFKEAIDWLGLIKQKLTPERLSYKQVTFFPENNQSNQKSFQTKSVEVNTENKQF